MRRRTLLTLALGTVASRAWAVGDGRLGRGGDGRLHLRQGSGGQVGQPALPTTTQSATAVGEDRWAKEIAAFVAEDEARPFAPGGVVFVGSSSIRLWDLATAFPGRRVLNRGFGGTQIPDSVRHVERLVLRHRPATVVFYAGDNDLSSGRTPEEVTAAFATFVARVHAALPATRIAFIGIKPSLARWAIVDKVRAANRLVRDACDRDDRLGFVDVDGPMIGWDGKPPRRPVREGRACTSRRRGTRCGTSWCRPSSIREGRPSRPSMGRPSRPSMSDRARPSMSDGCPGRP